MATQVTVFGGTGYLGREVVRQLARAGTVRVRIAVRHPARAGAIVDAAHVERVEADVTRPETVRRALDGSDGAVNAVKGPNALREAVKAHAALGTLQRHGWLVPLDPGAVVRDKPRKAAWRIVRGAPDVV